MQNEDLSLRLAREVLGAEFVTAAAPGQVAGIEGLALLVERFDRDGGNRLRMEDFAQILGKPRGRAFEGKYDSSYEEAGSAIERFSARPRLDLLAYFRLVVFNLVIGNADAHLKNFSLLERAEGLRLSPAYDLVNTLAYPDYSREAALEIAGRKRSFDTLSRPIVAELGAALSLPWRAIDASLKTLERRFANAAALRFTVPLRPGEFRERYVEVVHDNARRIFA